MTQARLAIAGANTPAIIANGHAAVGIAGEPRRHTLGAVEAAISVTQAAAYQTSGRIGDQAAVSAWRRGCWFSAFNYLVKPAPAGGVTWRTGMGELFQRSARRLPLLIDNVGFSREITGNAPAWAKDEELYPAIIDLIDPDGYAAWDYPLEGAEYKQRTLQALRNLMDIYPADIDNGRMWPVFSVRWTWDERAAPRFNSLPGWGSRALQTMIPLTKTQRHYFTEQREEWARQAVANALLLASDPDFRWMAKTFGRVMIGGLVGGSVKRIARHLFAATLCQLFPDCQFWLLGQANFAVVNGLAALGLLDRVWVDGTWYLHDARADTFAVLDSGLITMNQIRRDRAHSAQTFFTLGELMAANLRALLAAYLKGHEWWPVPLGPGALPLDWRDVDLLSELKGHFQAAQLELGLFAA